MSQEKLLLKLKASPEFKALVRSRVRVSVILSFIMVAFYSSFYLCMAWLPGFMATPISDTGVVTIGLCYGIASMLLAATLSGVYAWWSGHRYETRKAALLQQLSDAQD